jgi:hypothetical protein
MSLIRRYADFAAAAGLPVTEGKIGKARLSVPTTVLSQELISRMKGLGA